MFSKHSKWHETTNSRTDVTLQAIPTRGPNDLKLSQILPRREQPIMRFLYPLRNLPLLLEKIIMDLSISVQFSSVERSEIPPHCEQSGCNVTIV